MRDAELARAVGLADPGERSCRGCHLEGSSPSLAPFDLKEKVKLIDHWTAEREARKAHATAAQPDRGAGGVGSAEPAGRAAPGPPETAGQASR